VAVMEQVRFREELRDLYVRLLKEGEVWNCQMFEQSLLVENAKSQKRIEILFDPMRQVPLIFTRDKLMQEWPGIFSQAEHALTGEIGYAFHTCGMVDQPLYDQIYHIFDLIR